MSWSDWDYLGEGLEKALEAVRRRARAVEAEHGYDPDGAEAGAIAAIEERLCAAAFNDRIAAAGRIGLALGLAADIAALPDGAMPYGQRMLVSLDLEQAANTEKRNIDPSRPFVP